MPRAAYNVSRQRSTRNAISINAMLTWRARRLRSLRLKEWDVDAIWSDIAAIDRVLANVLGYTGDIEAETRDFSRETLFRRGDLQRMVCTVLREANRPLTTREITAIVISRKGLTMDNYRQAKQWINRVRKVCQRLPGLDQTLADDGCQAWAVGRMRGGSASARGYGP